VAHVDAPDNAVPHRHRRAEQGEMRAAEQVEEAYPAGYHAVRRLRGYASLSWASSGVRSRSPFREEQ
jgi:hypothetical protein